MARKTDISIEVALRLKPFDSKIYGYQRKTSAAIALLRRQGLLTDVQERCAHCKCARTRSHRNVPLSVTDEAQRLMDGAR